jgi:hypothetical protein
MRWVRVVVVVALLVVLLIITRFTHDAYRHVDRWRSKCLRALDEATASAEALRKQTATVEAQAASVAAAQMRLGADAKEQQSVGSMMGARIAQHEADVCCLRATKAVLQSYKRASGVLPDVLELERHLPSLESLDDRRHTNARNITASTFQVMVFADNTNAELNIHERRLVLQHSAALQNATSGWSVQILDQRICRHAAALSTCLLTDIDFTPSQAFNFGLRASLGAAAAVFIATSALAREQFDVAHLQAIVRESSFSSVLWVSTDPMIVALRRPDVVAEAIGGADTALLDASWAFADVAERLAWRGHPTVIVTDATNASDLWPAAPSVHSAIGQYVGAKWLRMTNHQYASLSLTTICTGDGVGAMVRGSVLHSTVIGSNLRPRNISIAWVLHAHDANHPRSVSNLTVCGRQA